MDWIERVFHVSPDGGNGSFEVVVLLGALVLFTAALRRWRIRRVRRRPHGAQPAPRRSAVKILQK